MTLILPQKWTVRRESEDELEKSKAIYFSLYAMNRLKHSHQMLGRNADTSKYCLELYAFLRLF